MMMKRILALLALAFLAQGMNAQDNIWGETRTDSIRCWENYNNFGSLANQRQYAQAFDHWKIVYETCPAVKEVIYKFGPRVIEGKMEALDQMIASTADEAAKAELVAERAALVDLLFEQYESRMQYFPGTEAYVKASMAQDIYGYYGDTAYNRVYNLFNEAMDIDPTQMSASQFWTFFKVAVELKDRDVLDLADIFEVYNRIDESVAANTDALNVEIAELVVMEEAGSLDERGQRVLASNRSKLENYEKVKGNVGTALRGLLTSCEIIARVYNEETFEQNKDNEVWIRRAVRTLGAEYRTDSGTVITCRDNPLYFQLTEVLYQMNPSTEAARNMGRLAMYREEYEKAIDYFSQAIDGELDPALRSTDYTRMAAAQQQLGRLSSAKSSLMNAISENAQNGRAQLQLAGVYMAADGVCGENAFEKGAVYWAAINRLNRAKSIDPSLTNAANTLIQQCWARVPDKGVSFRLGKQEGDTYTIGCWINETITATWP